MIITFLELDSWPGGQFFIFPIVGVVGCLGNKLDWSNVLVNVRKQ